MKTIRVIFTIVILSVSVYLVSCDVINVQNNNEYADYHRKNKNAWYDCDNPNSCSTVVHCLYFEVDDPDTDPIETIDPLTILGIRVTISGFDCTNQSYFCEYTTSYGNGNPHTLGSSIPWYDYDCKYTKTIVIGSSDGGCWVGSEYFEYPNATFYVHLTYDPNMRW